MNDDPAASYYFALLRTVVDDLTANGRRSFAAGLKPRLQALSNGEFAETRLGFPTFKAFLEAANEAGIVELRRTPSDLMVLPRITEADSAVRATPSATVQIGPGQRIRPDFWRAWVEWSPDLKRFYDRSADRVVFLLDTENADEPEHVATTRKQMTQRPDRYVAIEPLGATATVEAMRTFASGWDDTTERDAMLQALGAAEPEKAALAFTRFLRVRTRIAGAWHLTRMQQVAQSIAEWAVEHGVATNYLLDASSGRRSAVTAVSPLSLDEVALRSRIVSAVQRMPLADLLRLPIPVEYLLGL